MDKRCLLIVEDDPGLQKQMRWCVTDAETFVASNVKEAEQVLRKEEPQVVTLDLGLPPDPGGTSQGYACLDLIRSLLPRTKVIVITGREEREPAIEAIGRGAYDFYQKPIDSQTLQFVVDRAFRLRELEDENRRLLAGTTTPLEGLITNDEAMQAVSRMVERVAPTDATVTILGATGTGKEIIARNLHALSDRREGPFVAINCAAIPENLLESELFGHEKGAFTGAVSRKAGRIEAANGGTLFLDEIGDMPMALQAKILRFLQERTFERVGGNVSIEADVRVLCATHNDLETMIGDGRFREDLYYRLSEIVIRLPPLKDRTDDSVLLATYFIKENSERRIRLSNEAQNAIRAYDWPGNIRELENRIRRALILCDEDLIEASDLELAPPSDDDLPLNLRTVRATAEREAILRALSRSASNVSQAARLLGVSRPTLYNLFEKYEINPDNQS
jgi:two-component system NtrC family response regulator